MTKPPTPFLAESSTPSHGGVRFSLFGIPVRVASSFWFIAILFGTQGASRSGSAEKAVLQAAVWTGIVFVSVLLHEVGHAATARAFGARPSITLHAMGGLTHFDAVGMSRPQRWLVSFSGPAVGLLIGTAVAALAYFYPLGTEEGRSIVGSILWVNIGWSLINLLPVVPFDGGHMLAAFLGPRRALFTELISAFVGASAAVLGLVYLESLWIALLFGTATASAIRQVRWLWLSKADRDAGLEEELALARAAIARGDVAEALARSEGVAERARTSAVRNAALLGQAWAHATEGHPILARELIERLDAGVPTDAYLVAVVEDALGSPDRARAWLEAEMRQGGKRAESIKLLIDLAAREGDLTRAVEVAEQALDVLSPDDAKAVLAAATAGGAHVEAARLAARMAETYGGGADEALDARSASASGPPRPV